MNTIRGIDEIVYGADDLAACKQFFLDWGLALQSEDEGGLLFETLNGCRVRVKRADDATLPPAMEAGSTLREVIWGADSQAVLTAWLTSWPISLVTSAPMAASAALTRMASLCACSSRKSTTSMCNAPP